MEEIWGQVELTQHPKRYKTVQPYLIHFQTEFDDLLPLRVYSVILKMQICIYFFGFIFSKKRLQKFQHKNSTDTT